MDAAGNLYGTTNQGGAVGAARSLNSLPPTMAGSIKSSPASLMALMMVVAQRRAWFLTVPGTSTGLPHSGVAPICYGSGCGTVFKLALNWYAAGAKAFYLVSQEQTATAGIRIAILSSIGRETCTEQQAAAQPLGFAGVYSGEKYGGVPFSRLNVTPNKPIIPGKTKGPDVITLDPVTPGRWAKQPNRSFNAPPQMARRNIHLHPVCREVELVRSSGDVLRVSRKQVL
jgi:hypothetical protein